MTPDIPPSSSRRADLRRAEHRQRRQRVRVVLAGVLVSAIGLVGVPVLASLAQPAPLARASVVAAAQTLEVPEGVAVPPVTRDSFTVRDAVADLSASGTNVDWATLVLVLGEFPTSADNVTVITRWMRQENYTDSWWQRNNPLNNGWGSGGGSGLGTYDSLVMAAENAAEALHENPGYSGIVAALESSSSADATAAAIWASPWASSHYAGGSHWSTTAVPVVKAPASAWG